jgi:hypothetical protein
LLFLLISPFVFAVIAWEGWSVSFLAQLVYQPLLHPFFAKNCMATRSKSCRPARYLLSPPVIWFTMDSFFLVIQRIVLLRLAVH